MRLRIDGTEYDVEISGTHVRVGETELPVALNKTERGYIATVGTRRIRLEQRAGTWFVDEESHAVEVLDMPAPRAKAAKTVAQAGSGEKTITAHMPGQVAAIRVQPGQEVNPDTVVAVIEAMKMENEITAGTAGIVKSVPISVGASVNQGDTLVELE